MAHAKTFLKQSLTGKTPWTYLYLFLVPFVNWSFAHVPTVPLPHGGEWPPLAIVTGLILVVRDLAQREVGHYIFVPLAIGIAISFAMAPAEIALASAAAFAISESIDWALFTFLKKPLSKRIFLSAGISSPIDSTVFIFLASFKVKNIFNPYSVIASIISKLVGCVIVYYMLKYREKRAETDKALTEPS